MSRRTLLFALVLFATSTCRASDTVSMKIAHFGLEGLYSPRAGQAWVQVRLRNMTGRALQLELVVAEVDLGRNAVPLTGTYHESLQLAPREERAADVPLPISKGSRPVVYVEARDDRGLPLGRTAVRVLPAADGNIIGLFCDSSEHCRAMQQAILLTGEVEEQARKARNIRIALLTELPPVWWAYTGASRIVLAASIAGISQPQRDALEAYVHRGGTLVLVEDQIAEPASAPRFLAPYRAGAAEGQLIAVGEGKLLRVRSVTGKDFGDFFRTLGLAETSPEELRKQLQRYLGAPERTINPSSQSWMISRLATAFHFPSFSSLLLSMAGYLVLVGLLNFVVLRRLSRPEWGWITIPAIALLCAVAFYIFSARNRPRVFGYDQITVYHLDAQSSLATLDSTVRVSSPKRGEVRPVVPGELIYSPSRRYPWMEAIEGFYAGGADLEQIQLGPPWSSEFRLRKWSYRDLDFEGIRRFAGSVTRDSSGKLHNSTGVDLEQALVVDDAFVYTLGTMPAGASVDLGAVARRPYEEVAGHASASDHPLPGPPFQVPAKYEEGESVAGAVHLHNAVQWKDLEGRPFSLDEFVMGWPFRPEMVFSGTRAVFFGLRREADSGARLAGRDAQMNSYSLVVVVFHKWP